MFEITKMHLANIPNEITKMRKHTTNNCVRDSITLWGREWTESGEQKLWFCKSLGDDDGAEEQYIDGGSEGILVSMAKGWNL